MILEYMGASPEEIKDVQLEDREGVAVTPGRSGGATWT